MTDASCAGLKSSVTRPSFLHRHAYPELLRARPPRTWGGGGAATESLVDCRREDAALAISGFITFGRSYIESDAECFADLRVARFSSMCPDIHICTAIAKRQHAALHGKPGME